ncbi:hypothetical protein [Clostridium perfringens]|uniref:hypothetical protein n=1 Tax=Clostridium perfringens TaxID=1502 RepID=UPI0039EAA18A
MKKLQNFYRKHIKIFYIIYILIILFILFIAIPLLLNHGPINSDYPSKASNDGLISFLGSYLGGIFGGVGTLIALYITVKQTREIQQVNRLQQEKSERKQLVAEIETLIGKYLADIGFYFYAQALENDKSDFNRSNAILYYRILTVKLARNDYANNLISLLDEIHNDKCFFRNYNNKNREDIFKEWEEKLNELSIAVGEFGENYINMKKKIRR